MKKTVFSFAVGGTCLEKADLLIVERIPEADEIKRRRRRVRPGSSRACRRDAEGPRVRLRISRVRHCRFPEASLDVRPVIGSAIVESSNRRQKKKPAAHSGK